MTSRISFHVGGDWSGLGVGARVKASLAGSSFAAGTVVDLNPLGGLVRVRFDHGAESWVGRSNVVLLSPAPAVMEPPSQPVDEPPAPVALSTSVVVASVPIAQPVASEMPVILDASTSDVVASVPVAEPVAPANTMALDVSSQTQSDTDSPSVRETAIAEPQPAAMPALRGSDAHASEHSDAPVEAGSLDDVERAPASVAAFVPTTDVLGGAADRWEEIALSAPSTEADVSVEWRQRFDSPEVRSVFEHLGRHGTINEGELITKLGSARAFRRFSAEFENHARHAPFRVRIESGAEGKRYVKDGDK